MIFESLCSDLSPAHLFWNLCCAHLHCPHTGLSPPATVHPSVGDRAGHPSFGARESKNSLFSRNFLPTYTAGLSPSATVPPSVGDWAGRPSFSVWESKKKFAFFSKFFSLFSSLTNQRQPMRCPGSPPNGGISGLLVIGGSSPPPGYINDNTSKRITLVIRANCYWLREL